MLFADNLFLYDDKDKVRIKSTFQFSGFEVELLLHAKEIEVVRNDKTTSIPINENSLILITVNQGGINRGPNTDAQVYVKNGEEIILISHFSYTEPINDLRKTKLYELVENIATRICTKYNIKWEYKLSIETPESKRRFSQGLIILVLIWAVLIILFLVNR